MLLRTLIERRRRQLGAKRFEQERERFGISLEDLEAAKRGDLRSRVEGPLSGLLGVPVTELQQAALTQLEEEYEDDEESEGTEEVETQPGATSERNACLN